MDYINIPGTNKRITVGSVVIVARYPVSQWIVQNGWYPVGDDQQSGWYLCSIPDQTIVPLLQSDMKSITVISSTDYSPRPPIHPSNPPANVPPDMFRSVESYAKGSYYVAGQLVWLTAGKLYQVTKNFRASWSEANTVDNLQIDITTGNLVPIIASAEEV